MTVECVARDWDRTVADWRYCSEPAVSPEGECVEHARLTKDIHDAHAARGENHWFSCPLCDDEDPEG